MIGTCFAVHNTALQRRSKLKVSRGEYYLRLFVCRGVQASSPILSRSMAVHCCIMRVTPLACSTWLAALPGCCSALLPK